MKESDPMPCRDRAGPVPSVSVLLPNYNHARLIGRMLQSLVDQTRSPDEIILVDDCSTDDSIDVIESFRARLPQMKLLRNPQNLGLNGTMNRALAEASCSHVVNAGADDWFEPAFVEKMTDAMVRFPQARLCISQFVEFLEAENRLYAYGEDEESGTWYAGGQTRFVTPEQLGEFLHQRYVWLPASGALIHRDTFRSIGGYDAALRWHSDWFVTYTIAFRHGFAIVPEPLSIFRVAAGTYSAGTRDPAKEREVSRAIYDKLTQPEFRDIRDKMRRHPAVFTPFFRDMALALPGDPKAWPFLSSLALWWLGEIARGRRPRALRDFVRARRAAAQQRRAGLQQQR